MKNKIMFSGVITMLIILSLNFVSFNEVGAKSTSSPSDFVIKDGLLVKYKGSASEVIIPDGVKEIGGGKFLANNGLNYNNTITSVVIPDSVTKIGVNAFYMCTSLAKIDIPDSVTTIEQGAFSSCSSLSEINIPKSVTTIASKMTFFNTPWLKAKETESDFVIVNNILVSGSKAKGEVKVPEGVKKLANSSMSFTAITKISLPKSLVEIGESAFAGCAELKEVHMKNNVKTIGDGIFEGCKALEVLKLSNKLGELGDIFSDPGVGKKLKVLEIPASVKKIHKNAFSLNTKLLTISVHKNSAMHKYAQKSNLKYKVIDTGGNVQTPKYKVIKVKKGDSLWKIASKQLGKGSRFKEIVKLNKLKGANVYVGQKLKIPAK